MHLVCLWVVVVVVVVVVVAWRRPGVCGLSPLQLRQASPHLGPPINSLLLLRSFLLLLLAVARRWRLDLLLWLPLPLLLLHRPPRLLLAPEVHQGMPLI